MDIEKLRGVADRAGSAAARLSAALSFASAAGLILAAAVMLRNAPAPGLAPVPAAEPANIAAAPRETTAAAGAARESVAPPAVEAAKPGEATGLELVRARLVEVMDVAVKSEPGGLETHAARSRKAKEASDEVVPTTTWDGRPAVRPEAAPAAAPAAKPAVDAAPAAVKPAASTEKAKLQPAASSAGDKSDKSDATAAPGKAPAGTGEAAPAAAAGEPPAEPPKEVWTDAEVATALRECLALLGQVAAEIEPAEPTRKGACGAPAPVKLKSVGRGATKVDFAPALEVNCKLAVKLSSWAETHLQPAAKDMLGTSVSRIIGGGGYSCRNRYGLAVAPLSEHALANAVDLPAFVLADGRTIKVASDWGPTDRDIAAAKIAAAAAAKAAANAPPAGDKAKVEAEQPADTGKKGAKAKGKKPDASAGGQTASGKAGSAPDEAAQASPAGAEAKVPGKKGSAKGKAEAAAQTDVDATAKGGKPGDKRKVAALKGGAMQNLGAGATLVSAKAPVSVSPEDRDKPAGKFLRRISQGACATFGTVLGPEANDAHRDHFHFDMKERKRAAYCQ